MIKILIVLEEEDGIDFRAYSLQISNGSNDLPLHVKMDDMIETNEGARTGNNLSQPHSTGPEPGTVPSFAQQIKRPLESKQIFMN